MQSHSLPRCLRRGRALLDCSLLGNDPTHLQAGHLRDQAGQQRVARDVEGDAQAHVPAALVHAAAELPALHVELREHVARRQRHGGQRRRVPGAQDDAPVGRAAADGVDDLRQLVYALAAADE